MKLYEEIEDESQLANKQTAMCGSHRCIQRHTKLTTIIIPSNSRPKRNVPFDANDLLRGSIVISTCDQHKNLCIPLFLPTIFGPHYYVLGNICVDQLQARPVVVGGEAGMAKHSLRMCLHEYSAFIYNTYS